MSKKKTNGIVIMVMCESEMERAYLVEGDYDGFESDMRALTTRLKLALGSKNVCVVNRVLSGAGSTVSELADSIVKDHLFDQKLAREGEEAEETG